MYYWSDFGKCQVYDSDKQGGADCGNGFQSSRQSKCLVGPARDETDNYGYCPPPGLRVQNCYIPCGGEYYWMRCKPFKLKCNLFCIKESLCS